MMGAGKMDERQDSRVWLRHCHAPKQRATSCCAIPDAIVKTNPSLLLLLLPGHQEGGEEWGGQAGHFGSVLKPQEVCHVQNIKMMQMSNVQP